MTENPIRQVLRKPNLVGRMIAWSTELFELSLEYRPRGSIKAQVLIDFIVELPPPMTDSNKEWKCTLYVDGSSNNKGSGAGVILEDMNGVSIEQSLWLIFEINNSQAEYADLFASLKLAKELGI